MNVVRVSSRVAMIVSLRWMRYAVIVPAVGDHSRSTAAPRCVGGASTGGSGGMAATALTVGDVAVLPSAGYNELTTTRR